MADQIKKVIRQALLYKTKLQNKTYQLSRMDLQSLILIIKRIEDNVPRTIDCNKIKPDRHVVDDELFEMENLLKNSRNGNVNVNVIVNFRWNPQKINNFSVALMDIIVFYEDDGKTFTMHIKKCIATFERMHMDNILPEINLFLMHRYIFAKDIVKENLDSLLTDIPNLFKNPTEDQINRIISMLDSKKKDLRLYLCLRMFLKKSHQEEYWVIKLSIIYNNRLNNFEFTFQQNERGRMFQIIKKLVSANKNPLQKLRSFASSRNLPFYEKTYHTTEEKIIEFNENFHNTEWFDIGFLIYTMKIEHWDNLPIYSGIFPIHLGICLEGNVIHFALHIPYIEVDVETQLIAENKQGILKFFPDEKYKKAIRKHALNPNIPLPPEDTFLKPYIIDDRISIISENVRVPTNKSLPSHLVGDIEKMRQKYKNKLYQYYKKFPDRISKFQVHKSYIQDMKQIQEQQKRKQQEAQQRKKQQEAQLMRELDKYDTPDDIIDEILMKFNLIDPINFEPIVNPVRTPYSQKHFYQKQSIQKWLSKGGLRLDPNSGKGMPTSFVPIVDQNMKSFIMELSNKINEIMENKDIDADSKKFLLLRLYHDLLRKDVLQTVIKKKNGLRI